MFALGSISQLYKFKYLLLSYVEALKDAYPVEVAQKKNQSPIAIYQGDITPKTMYPLEFHDYQTPYRIAVENTGHTIALHFMTKFLDENGADEAEELPTPSIIGGPLEAQYFLDHIHFHWESEHVLDGMRYPLEAHFVHYRCDLDPKTAKLYKHGIVVLSVMYEMCKCKIEVFEDISDTAKDLSREFHCPTMIESQLCCRDFLPKNFNSYYTYEGSLTTPDYNEGVIWIVFDEPSRIERRQLQKLTQIMGHDNRPLVSNNRLLQELNERQIYYNGGVFDRIRKVLRNYRNRKDGPRCES